MKTKTKRKKYNTTYGGKQTRRKRTIRFFFYLILILCVLVGSNIFQYKLFNITKNDLKILETQKILSEKEVDSLKKKYQDRLDDEKEIAVLKDTQMEDAIPYILEASEYYEVPVEIFIGIANAESSFRNFRCYNPWGIDTGKGNDPRCYDSWEHSVNGFAQLIKYYYINEGLTTPEKIKLKYVGWDNPHWASNVRKYYNP